ncbi:MAG: hypothetical protein IT323_09595 [Anaerolineae bacterium]|nr:hypothetical protein [Anaerolineae bacterium]
MNAGSARSGQRRLWMLVGFLALGLALALLLTGVSRTEASLSAGRFVANLQAGRGLVFGLVGPDVTTYPLAALANATPMAAPLAGLAIGAAAWLLVGLAGGQVVAGLALIGAFFVQPSPAIALMLALAALDCARLARWWAAGALIGLAILAAPQAIIPALLLLALAYRGPGAVWRYALPAAFIPALAMGALLAWTGARAIVALDPGGWMPALAALAGFALLWALRRGAKLPATTALLVAWSAVEALIALVTGSAPSAAFAPGAILAALSLAQRTATPNVRARAVIAVLLIAAIAADALLSVGGVLQPVSSAVTGADIEVGQWIAANAPPDATVATDRIGVLAQVAARPAHDLSGRFGGAPPDPSFIARDAPFLVVDHPDLPGRGYLEPGLSAFYAPVLNAGLLAVYQRTLPAPPLNDHAVDVNFSAALGRDDLRLVGVGIADTLRPGELARVRLDWRLAYAPGFDVQIKLDLLTPDFAGLGGVTDTLPPDRWRAGAVSTYHAFVVSPDAAPGAASLYINVGIRAATMGIVKIADVQIAAGE